MHVPCRKGAWTLHSQDKAPFTAWILLGVCHLYIHWTPQSRQAQVRALPEPSSLLASCLTPGSSAATCRSGQIQQPVLGSGVGWRWQHRGCGEEGQDRAIWLLGCSCVWACVWRTGLWCSGINLACYLSTSSQEIAIVVISVRWLICTVITAGKYWSRKTKHIIHLNLRCAAFTWQFAICDTQVYF